MKQVAQHYSEEVFGKTALDIYLIIFFFPPGFEWVVIEWQQNAML